MARDDAFYFANGIYAEDLKELRDILRSIDGEFVQHHITPEKNDFAAWVRHVHGDEELARRLEKCRGVQQVVEVLNTRLEKSGGSPPTRQEPQPQPARAAPSSEETAKFYERAYTRDFLFGFLIGVVCAIAAYQLIKAVI